MVLFVFYLRFTFAANISLEPIDLLISLLNYQTCHNQVWHFIQFCARPTCALQYFEL